MTTEQVREYLDARIRMGYGITISLHVDELDKLLAVVEAARKIHTDPSDRCDGEHLELRRALAELEKQQWI